MKQEKESEPNGTIVEDDYAEAKAHVPSVATCLLKKVQVGDEAFEIFVKKAKKKTSSIYKGVKLAKDGSSWIANMVWGGVTQRLGRHESEVSAAIAWKQEFDRRQLLTFDEWYDSNMLENEEREMCKGKAKESTGSMKDVDTVSSAPLHPKKAETRLAHVPILKHCILEKVSLDGEGMKCTLNRSRQPPKCPSTKGVSQRKSKWYATIHCAAGRKMIFAPSEVAAAVTWKREYERRKTMTADEWQLEVARKEEEAKKKAEASSPEKKRKVEAKRGLKFCVGRAIEVLHKDKYYRGRVSLANESEYTYTITYDDGSVEQNVAEAKIRSSHWNVEITGTICVQDSYVKIDGQWNRSMALPYRCLTFKRKKRTTKKKVLDEDRRVELSAVSKNRSQTAH